MGRVSYPAIGETSDHPDVDRQSKPHNFRFSLLLFVKVRREQVWLTFYIPWKNQFVNRNIARPFLSSRENVFFFSTCIDGKGRPMFRLTIRLIPPFTLQGGCWSPSPLSHHTPHTTPQPSTLICPLTLPTLDRDRFWNSTPWKQTQEMGTTQTRGFLSLQKLAITSSVGRRGSNITVARAKTMLWSLS